MKKHAEYLDILCKVAENALPVSGARVASALVYRKRILAIGSNLAKTHPMQHKYTKHTCKIHAELNTLLKAYKIFPNLNYKNTTLYISRIKRPRAYAESWITGIAKPCLGCSEIISFFNIVNVVYTTEIGYDCIKNFNTSRQSITSYTIEKGFVGYDYP